MVGGGGGGEGGVGVHVGDGGDVLEVPKGAQPPRGFGWVFTWSSTSFLCPCGVGTEDEHDLADVKYRFAVVALLNPTHSTCISTLIRQV